MQDSAAFAHHLAVPVRLVVCPLVHVNFARGPRHLAEPAPLVVLELAHVDLASREKLVVALSIPLAVCPLAHVDLARGKRVLALSAHQAVFVLAHVDFAGGIVCVPCPLGIPLDLVQRKKRKKHNVGNEMTRLGKQETARPRRTSGGKLETDRTIKKFTLKHNGAVPTARPATSGAQH